MKTLLLLAVLTFSIYKTQAQEAEIINQINQIINRVDIYFSSGKLAKVDYNESTKIFTAKGELTDDWGQKNGNNVVSFDFTKIKRPKIITKKEYNGFTYTKLMIRSKNNDCIYITKNYDVSYISGGKELKTEVELYVKSKTLREELENLLAKLYDLVNLKQEDQLIPLLKFDKITIDETIKNRMIDLDEIFHLKTVVRNVGNAKSENISVNIEFIGNTKIEYGKTHSINYLLPNAEKQITIPIKASSASQSSNGKLILSLQDGLKKYSSKLELPISINIPPQTKEIFNKLSDVDLNIPENTLDNAYTYCLIVGNEHYSGSNNVKYAINDANLFYKYMNKTLGIQKRNIVLLKDATLNQLNESIEKLEKITELLKGRNRIILFYAGHGLPSKSNQSAILIPTDVTNVNRSNGIPIKELIDNLNKHNPEKLLVFIDACFSGTYRNEDFKSNERGVTIVPKPNINEINDNTFMITSSSDNESSYSYDEANHGLFTYYLLKKIKSSKGNLTMEELKEYIKKEVPLNSILLNNYKQTPQFFYNSNYPWDNYNLLKQ